MASVTLYRKRSCYGGTWSSWGAVTGQNIIGSSYYCHVVYSANVDMTGASSLTSVNFKDTFASDIIASLTLTAYLYTSDPTSSSPTSPPSGYVKSYSITKSITTDGIVNSIDFTSLGLSGNLTNLYVWITATYDATSGGIYCCDDSGISQPTAITGSFVQAVMSLSISPTAVTAGNKVSLTVANGSGYTLTATYKYGSTVLANYSFDTGSLETTCPANWFNVAGVTTLKTITINVSVTGGTSTLTGSFTLTAGSSMAPNVGTPTATIVQPSTASAYPSTYISGISKCKLAVSVTARTNATIRSVVATYPGGSQFSLTPNSDTGKYEGTTGAPLTGDTTFTITATDQRGMQTSKTVSVTGVVAYTTPSVTINTAYRCNSSGTEESGGAYWRIRVTASYCTDLSGNTVTITAGIKNGTMNTLTSGTLSSAFSGMSNSKSAYTVVVTVVDSVNSSTSKEIVLEGLLRNVVVTRSDDGTYVGIGTTPETTSGESTIELPLGGEILAGGHPLSAWIKSYNRSVNTGGSSFGKDFLNANASDADAAENAVAWFNKPANNTSWSNFPSSLSSYRWVGARLVFYISSSYQLVFIIEAYPQSGRIWTNCHTSSGWRGWRYIESTAYTE